MGLRALHQTTAKNKMYYGARQQKQAIELTKWLPLAAAAASGCWPAGWLAGCLLLLPINAHACISMNMYVHAYRCIRMHMQLRMHAHAYACKWIHIDAHACICMHINVHAHMHAYACISICMHAYAFGRGRGREREGGRGVGRRENCRNPQLAVQILDGPYKSM